MPDLNEADAYFPQQGETTRLLEEPTKAELTDTDRLRHKPLSETGGLFCCRHVLVGMLFLGFANVFALRFNLSVALVAMTNPVNDTAEKSNDSTQVCPSPGGTNTTSDNRRGEFDWDKETQGVILGAFFYGYIFMQLPGGWVASKFGAKRLLGWGIFATAVLVLLTPLAARTSVYLFIALRALEGITEGSVFPAVYALLGQWAPHWEKSRLLALSQFGIYFGTIMAMSVSGVLCESDVFGGWPSVFYIFGSISIVWCVAWLLIIYDTPAQHPRISHAEKEYILLSLRDTTYISPPWKDILTSPAVLAVITAHFCAQWGAFTMLTSIPRYMADILKFNIQQNGLLSALPYVATWVMVPTCGMLADLIRQRHILSTINTRRLFNSLGLLLPACFLVLEAHAGCDHVMNVLFLVLSVGLESLLFGGYAVNFLDLSPRFSGILYGISNTVATIPGFAGPALVGALTDGNGSRSQWQIVFYVAAAVYTFGTVIFLLFARGEEQPWSYDNQQLNNPSRKQQLSVGHVNT